MSKPKVLISDALSPAAVQIFRDRGVEVDFQPNLGKDKDKLAEAIDGFDGLAIRSATKVSAKLLEKAPKLKVIGRAGIGIDNVDVPAATARGVIVMNTPFGNSITTAEHAVTLMLSLARQIPEADASTPRTNWKKSGSRKVAPSIAAEHMAAKACGLPLHVAWFRGPDFRRPQAPSRTGPRKHGTRQVTVNNQPI